MGRADIEFGKATDQLNDVGLTTDARIFAQTLVGRNVLEGRWTFQVVDEFDALYYEVARDIVRQLERDHLDGRRHVFERHLKERRRTLGEPGHEMEPPA